ncbi:conserved hypothetical protein [Flavobacterium sp. 9AF]|uniref:hypothetical protein n=1 Tax=Flavobacterium sp. 9AF TaxID=2653142 RepID=UPI0012F27BA3|nr:hypothetical protein [Flavobacterium sp. 9AF]VXB18511.1 conserved hypothetical protein [Flavobacterium sp. 9AF]
MKNIKIRYYLEPKAKIVEERTKLELIMAEINYGYAEINKSGKKRHKPARFSLQESIKPSNFGKPETNFKFDDAVFKKANKNNATVRNRILNFETALNEIASSHIIANTLPTPTELKKSLAERLRTEVIQEPKDDILSYLYRKIEKEKADSEKSKKNSKRENTIKTYATVSHLLEKYQIATGETLLFESLDEAKYWKIWDTLDDILKGDVEVYNPNQPKKQRKQSYGYLVSSIRKHQRTLLTTLKEAMEDGNKIALDVYNKNLMLKNVEASKDFYIEIDELKKIISTDVSFDSKLQIAKEYIIIACLSGMRFESMYEAQKSKLQHCNDVGYNFSYIHSKQNKTSTEVYVPLLKPVQEIVNLKDGFPIIPKNAIINKHLKKLFKHLKFNKLVEVKKVTYRNGILTSKKPISDLISTHDCKGTFYTNLYSLNISERVIDNITHPDKKPKNAMARVYNKTSMLSKAKMFVDEVSKASSDVYTF